ncbi:MAG TPA: xanthine dehydrogenase family protein molybdopterin-binding subunit [Acidimicrobiales bacterium]|nr:xanthine dehydrogenase family protein molybdopterin-binding subunit [Acidimicrobiales bacterium]
MSILGNRVLRREDPAFLTTGGKYLDDLPLPGAAWMTFVRSTMPHARVLSIDVSEAREAPGVIDVVTTADLDIAPIAPFGFVNQEMAWPWLAGDTVRYVGEPVAIVVTEERYQGEDAAERVLVDYDPLPAVVDPVAALEEGAPLLYPAAGTNLATSLPGADDPALFDGCEVVVRRRIVNQRVAPCPLEARGAAARWGEDGRLTVWASTQTAHGVRDEISHRLGIDADRIHVIAPDVGGGFGAKIGNYPEDLIVGWVARRVGRPVKWVETRSESMVAMGHGRGQVQDVEIGGTGDGRILAYRLAVIQDSGAYPRLGAALPVMTRTMVDGVYAIPRVEFSSRSVVTNTTPTVAYRGAGRPEATAAVERAVDLFAAEIGMDPVDVRRRNFIGKAAFPYRASTGTTYDIGDYERALDLVLDAAGYDELRAEQRRRREAGDIVQVGIGVSTYVEITAGGGPANEFGAVEVLPDGKVRVRTGVSPHGQGHITSMSMIVADRLGVDLDDVEVVYGDTDAVPRGIGTMGSRSIQTGGVAVHRATGEVLQQAKQVAADLLEAGVEDVVYDPTVKHFHVIGTPAVARTLAEVAAAAPEGLLAEVDYQGTGPTFPFGAHVAVVEVDTETGKVRLRRLVAVDDAGRILNPMLAEGQVHGGLAQGIAQALFEEVRYDEDGNPITANLADYAFVSAAELPRFEVLHMETPTPVNELGAKGIGESGTIGATPAVQNAVVDALAHLGVRHVEMPATPERVWRAVRDASAGRGYAGGG